MTKKRKTGLVIGAVVACIAVLCAAGACNGAVREENAVHRVIVTTTTATTQPVEISTVLTPLTTTTAITTTATTTTEPQITTAATCATTETTTITAEQITAADTTVQPITTTTSATTTTPVQAESYHGQTSGDYIYVNGFGWIFNEGGGGEGSVNYEMYCNGNKIGYFG